MRRRRAKIATHYRPDQAEAIGRLELRRARLGISHEALAARAGLSRATWMRMRADGRAWRRHIVMLRMALRSLERERAVLDRQYEVIG